MSTGAFSLADIDKPTPKGKFSMADLDKLPPATDTSDTGVLGSLKRSTVGLVTGLYHAFTDPATDQEKAALLKKIQTQNAKGDSIPESLATSPSTATLAYHRLIDAPADELELKGSNARAAAKDLIKHGDIMKGVDQYLSGAANSGLSAVPVLGPVINNIAERFESGDKSGAATDLATLVATPHIAKAVGGLAEATTEFSPRSVNKIGQVEGAARPANIAEGAINRSVGATKALTAYGNPAKAIIDERIASPTTIGRTVETYQKLGELAPQLQQALQASPATVDLFATVKPIVDAAKDAINKSLETPGQKMLALRQLAPLEQRASTSGVVPVKVANDFKDLIGDTVNWEKRPSPLPKPVEEAYKKAYGAVKDQVNAGIPGQEELSERVTNLMSLKRSLQEQAQPSIKIGQGPEAGGFGWVQRLEAMMGHVAAPAIIGAQAATGAAAQAAPAVAQGASIGAQLLAKHKKLPQAPPETPGLPFHPNQGLTQ